MMNYNEIDWGAQWAAHGLNFRDGFVNIELEMFGCPKEQLHKIKTLKLEPGPGFGDLSHPTTRLVIKMMVPYVKGAYVLDIGSGSGVLALCAAAMGAKNVHGVEIDPYAVKHGRHNAKLNGLEGCVSFGLPSEYTVKDTNAILVLMNMISSEQKEAWASLKSVHRLPGESIVSGILAEERQSYLKLTESWGWTLKGESTEEGWLGLHFDRDKVR